jgi:repressor LexA
MLSVVQQKILEFIQRHLHEHQYPPTLREIQGHCGFSAIGTVQYHLKRLSQAGYLEVKPSLSRGIALTNRAIGIPIIGNVPAGPAQLAFEQLEGYLSPTTFHDASTTRSHGHAKDSTVPSATRHTDTRGLFALRVKGDSMIDAGILEGDLVVVRPQSSGKNGDIVVARIGDDEATVKRLVRKPGIITLAPANPRYKSTPVDDTTQILGKVIRVVRHYN